MPERFLRVTEPECGDLDAALSWVVQTIDTEKFDLPNIEITTFHSLDDDSTRYEASVRGLIGERDA